VYLGQIRELGQVAFEQRAGRPPVAADVRGTEAAVRWNNFFGF
jgi:hypothetical protein